MHNLSDFDYVLIVAVASLLITAVIAFGSVLTKSPGDNWSEVRKANEQDAAARAAKRRNPINDRPIRKSGLGCLDRFL